MFMWYMHLDLSQHPKNAETEVYLASRATESQLSIKYLMTFKDCG